MNVDLPNENPKYITEDRDTALKEAREIFSDLEERFKPGSLGYFEAIDRSMILKRLNIIMELNS